MVRQFSCRERAHSFDMAVWWKKTEFIIPDSQKGGAARVGVLHCNYAAMKILATRLKLFRRREGTPQVSTAHEGRGVRGGHWRPPSETQFQCESPNGWNLP